MPTRRFDDVTWSPPPPSLLPSLPPPSGFAVEPLPQAAPSKAARTTARRPIGNFRVAMMNAILE